MIDGWSPTTVTRHTYRKGRVVASTTTTDPEWSPLDYAEMQALAHYEASLCPGCQRPLDICAADYEAQTAVAAVPHICNVAVARAVQYRIDEWHNTPQDKRAADEAPLQSKWNDGRYYLTRPPTPEELAEAR